MSKQTITQYYVFSPFLRIFHWTMVICIFVLFATGLYIGNPGYIGSVGVEPTFAIGNLFSMEHIRLVHFVAAGILCAALILRIYGFIVNKGDRLLPRFDSKHYWKNTSETLQYYLFLRKSHTPVLRNSLARTSYFFIYLVLIAQIATGFALYFPIRPDSFGYTLFNWINVVCGEYSVHLIHHYLAWVFVLFVIVHVYMALRADMMHPEGEISSMFSGVKFLEHEPADVGDIRDEEKDDYPVRSREHSPAR